MDWSDMQTLVRVWSLRPWLYMWHQAFPLENPDKVVDERWRKWLREASLLEKNRHESLGELSDDEMSVADRAYKAFTIVFKDQRRFQTSVEDLGKINNIVKQVAPRPLTEALEQMTSAALKLPAIKLWSSELANQDDVLLLIFVCYNYCVIKRVCDKWEGGVAGLKKIMFNEKPDVQALRETGNQHFSEAKYLDAVKSYTKALNKQAYSYKLFSNRSQAHFEADQRRPAASDGLRCIRINPRWEKGWRRYANGLFYMGLYIDAWQANMEGQRFNPKSEQLKQQAVEFQTNLEAAAQIQSRVSSTGSKSKARACSSCRSCGHTAGHTTCKIPGATPATAPNTKTKETKAEGKVLADWGLLGKPDESKKPEKKDEPTPKVTTTINLDSMKEPPELVPALTPSTRNTEPPGLIKAKSNGSAKSGSTDTALPKLASSQPPSTKAQPAKPTPKLSISIVNQNIKPESGKTSKTVLTIETGKAAAASKSTKADFNSPTLSEFKFIKAAAAPVVAAAPKSKPADPKPTPASGTTGQPKKPAKETTHVAATSKDNKSKRTASRKSTPSISEGPEALSARSDLDQGTKSLLEKRMRNAITFYAQALGSLNDQILIELKYHGEQVAVIKYALGYAHYCTGTSADITEGYSAFYSITREHEEIVFPLAYLGMGMCMCRIHDYTKAWQCLSKGLRIVNNHPDLPVLTWPESTVPIPETMENELKSVFEYYLAMCRHPPKPDATCRYATCVMVKERAIYISSPEFKGYVEVHCYEHCRVCYHCDCWKMVKTTSDKEILSGSCWTPDCSAPLKKIIIFDRNGEISKDLHSEINYAPNEGKARKPVIKMKPSSQNTIERRRQRKLNRRRRQEEDRAERQRQLLQSEAQENEENSGDNVSAAPNIDLNQCTKIEPRRDDGDEEQKKQKKKKKKGKDKDKVLTLITFNNQDKSSPDPPSTPSLGSMGGLDDIDDRVEPSLHMDPERPFSVPSHLAPAIAQFESGRMLPSSPVPAPEPAPNPWTRKHTLTESTCGSSQPSHASDDEDIDEVNNRLAIRNSLFELFKDLLQKHGPLHFEDPLILSEVADFPPSTQEIIDNEGGINKFLGKSLYFAIHSDHVGLLKDAAKLRKMATKKKGASKKKSALTSGESSKKVEKPVPEPVLVLPSSTPSPCPSVGSEGREGTPETSSSVSTGKCTPSAPVETHHNVPSSSPLPPSGAGGGAPSPVPPHHHQQHHPPPQLMSLNIPAGESTNQLSVKGSGNPVLDQYLLGVNRLHVAVELGKLALSLNIPLGVEVRLRYGWKAFDGLTDGVSQEAREKAVNLLLDAINLVMKSSHRNYHADGADIYFFGVGETSADGRRWEWVTGPEVGRNPKVAIFLMFGDFSTIRVENLPVNDQLKHQALVYVKRAADFIFQCSDRFRASVDIQKAIFPIFNILGQKATRDPETLSLLEGAPIPAIPVSKPPPGLGPIGANRSSSDTHPSSTAPSPLLPSPLLPTPTLSSIAHSYFMPPASLPSHSIWSNHNGFGPAPSPASPHPPASLSNSHHSLFGLMEKKESASELMCQQLQQEKQMILAQVSQFKKELDNARIQASQEQQKRDDLEVERKKFTESYQKLNSLYQKSLVERDEQIKRFDLQQENHEADSEEKNREINVLKKEILQLTKNDKLTKAEAEIKELRSQLKAEKERRHNIEMKREEELLEHNRSRGELESNYHDEKLRAQMAEINQLRIKLDVGLKIINRSAKEAEAQISERQKEIQQCQSYGGNYQAVEPLKFIEKEWKKTLGEVLKTRDKATAVFEEQIRRVNQGEKLSSLPMLDIPCPPPPPDLRAQMGSLAMAMTGRGGPGMDPSRSQMAAPPPSGVMPNHVEGGATRSKPTVADVVASARPPATSNGLQVNKTVGSAGIGRPPGMGAPSKQQQQPTQSQDSKKNSFDKLLDTLLPQYPQFDKTHMSAFLKQLREERGSLSGLSLMAVKDSMERLINRALHDGTVANPDAGWTLAGSKRGGGGSVALPQVTESHSHKLKSKQQPSSAAAHHAAAQAAHAAAAMVLAPEEEPCTICLEEINMAVNITLACQHKFHDLCIRRWFNQNSTCPLCQKHSLLPDEYPALC